jgi:hypothetical protein
MVTNLDVCRYPWDQPPVVPAPGPFPAPGPVPAPGPFPAPGPVAAPGPVHAPGPSPFPAPAAPFAHGAHGGAAWPAADIAHATRDVEIGDGVGDVTGGYVAGGGSGVSVRGDFSEAGALKVEHGAQGADATGGAHLAQTSGSLVAPPSDAAINVSNYELNAAAFENGHHNDEYTENDEDYAENDYDNIENARDWTELFGEE